MTREQAINYLFSCGFTNEQVGEVVRALTYEPTTKNDLALIHTEGLDEEIRCTMCTNSMKSDRGCDGSCSVNNDMYKAVIDVIGKRIQPSVTPFSSELEKNSKKLEINFGESDCISRKSIKQKLQEHHDFFVNAYGGFSNLPLNDKSRVDEITNCIAMVVNEPSVTPQEPILDKIRAEILEEHENAYAREDYDTAYGLGIALDITDKYKAESEKTDG